MVLLLTYSCWVLVWDPKLLKHRSTYNIKYFFISLSGCSFCLLDLLSRELLSSPLLSSFLEYRFLLLSLSFFITVSLRQAASQRTRPTSLPTWRPSHLCQRREHQERRLGSRCQHGAARSGPSKPLSSPRSNRHTYI